MFPTHLGFTRTSPPTLRGVRLRGGLHQARHTLQATALCHRQAVDGLLRFMPVDFSIRSSDLDPSVCFPPGVSQQHRLSVAFPSQPIYKKTKRYPFFIVSRQHKANKHSLKLRLLFSHCSQPCQALYQTVSIALTLPRAAQTDSNPHCPEMCDRVYEVCTRCMAQLGASTTRACGRAGSCGGPFDQPYTNGNMCLQCRLGCN
ncbi:hypothetical protein F5Y18DRAFT_16117 [Xylariaceae sp. FL1019]|nr:hypothetical protein F5Y18DRAFT_16117 [Xylariaceae sp. FL1019]